jgi:PBP1b-binding outer membrane lipoprotein LpoB
MMKKISFFLLIFISIFVLSGCNKDNSVIDKTNEQREKVIGLCEDEVLNQLKSP